jgi:hypothetical protein
MYVLVYIYISHVQLDNIYPRNWFTFQNITKHFGTIKSPDTDSWYKTSNINVKLTLTERLRFFLIFLSCKNINVLGNLRCFFHQVTFLRFETYIFGSNKLKHALRGLKFKLLDLAEHRETKGQMQRPQTQKDP